MVSHDWPEGIYKHGNTAALLKIKPFFQESIDKKALGNPHMMNLMKTLRPHWWFSAHLHVRFRAEYDHTVQGVSDGGKRQAGSSQGRSIGTSGSNIVKRTEENTNSENTSTETPAVPSTTKFLALDKCLPQRKFLEVNS
jgi:lariat debranching enzyme